MNIKTLDPDLTQINLFYKKEFYSAATNFLNTIQNYSKELEYSIAYNLSKVKNDPITSQTKVFVELDSAMKTMSPQFIDMWLKKFNSSLEAIKNQVRIKIGKGTFYRPVGDSVGCLAKIENYIDDSLQFVSDINGKTSMSPLRFGASLTNKLGPNTLLLHAEISKKTNIVFRKNIQNLQTQLKDPSTSHGENLIPDLNYFKKIQSALPGIIQKIQSEFKDMFKLIDFYCNYNPRLSTSNLQFAPNLNITVDVEGNKLNQDLLFNQLKEVTSSLTSQGVLKA